MNSIYRCYQDDIISLIHNSFFLFVNLLNFYQLLKYFKLKDIRDKYSWCENPNCEYIYKKRDYNPHQYMNKMNKVKIKDLKINHFNKIYNLLRVPNLLNRFKM